MTYDYVEKQVLKLLNQYTIAGTSVADTYNNQKDYLLRIPGLVNDAMMEIALTVRKIPVTISLEDLECVGELPTELRFIMPEDFFQLKSGDTLHLTHGLTAPTHTIRENGRYFIIVPKWAVRGPDTIFLTYYRYPHLIPGERANVDQSAELDNTPETHLAIPYYVAGMLALHDDAFLSSTLMNGYEDKLQKMIPDVTAESHRTIDAYDFYHVHEMY